MTSQPGWFALTTALEQSLQHALIFNACPNIKFRCLKIGQETCTRYVSRRVNMSPRTRCSTGSFAPLCRANQLLGIERLLMLVEHYIITVEVCSSCCGTTRRFTYQPLTQESEPALLPETYRGGTKAGPDRAAKIEPIPHAAEKTHLALDLSKIATRESYYLSFPWRVAARFSRISKVTLKVVH